MTANADVWEAHDPLRLAGELEDVALYLSWGNGESGPLDAPAGDQVDDTEAWLAPQNERMAARLEELGIPATIDAYGPGTHSWPYWEPSLHASLPVLLGALGE